jgi:predicted nucleic acid-binding protein
MQRDPFVAIGSDGRQRRTSEVHFVGSRGLWPWELRENLSTYDASYIALAELLDCELLTADARLGRSPGIRCSITLVPH